jgi:hypothetical protein
MFIVKCTNCGREQEWKAQVNVGTAEIQVAGFGVICSCESIVAEDHDVLREIRVDPNGVFD